MLPQNELIAAGIQFFTRLQKEHIDNKQKNHIKLGIKHFRKLKAILWPSKCVPLRFLQPPIMYYVTSY